MVVLAVTWMAKVGREGEVTAVFAKLTEESRKEPGCAMYQVHRHKTEAAALLHLRAVQGRCRTRGPSRTPHISCSTPAKTCLELPTAWKAICSSRSGRLVARALRPRARSLYFIRHQLPARSVAFLRYFMERHDDGFAPRSRFFNHCIGNALRDLPLLIGRAALQHRDLN